MTDGYGVGSLSIRFESRKMPSGKHTSVRVALAVPPKVHEQLTAWAEYEGRPIASLCMYLVENGLRQAQRDGLAPKWKTEGEADGIEKWEPEFEGYRKASIANKATREDRKNFTEYQKELVEEKMKQQQPSKEELLHAFLQAIKD